MAMKFFWCVLRNDCDRLDDQGGCPSQVKPFGDR